MRFSVTDRFAIDFSAKLYPLIFERKQTLPVALGATLAKLFSVNGGKPYPLLTLAIPALLGHRSLNLELRAQRVESFSPPKPPKGFSHLPQPPERLVGRIVELTNASRALAPESGRTGVVFYGMAGAGKSSCALELARLYEDLDRFKYLVFFEAPGLGKDIARSLVNFALRWESVVPGFPLLLMTDDKIDLESHLTDLGYFLEENAVLVVLDNLESLLREEPLETGETEWRDPNWAHLFAALHHHAGTSRVVSTSRLLPQLNANPLGKKAELERIPLHALTLDEALLLARQLPNLGRLIEAQGAEGLALIGRLLEVVQGHPKLLELADRQAKRPRQLSALLDLASDAKVAQKNSLQVFFEQGISSLEEADFQQQFTAWTVRILDALPGTTRLIFEILTWIEDTDRQSPLLESIWKQISAPLADDNIKLTDHLKRLQRFALVSSNPLGKAGEISIVDYQIHPGVAEVTRSAMDFSVQEVVDREAANFWLATFNLGRRLESKGSPGGHLVVQGALRATPYLLRRQNWNLAATLLEGVVQRDKSARTVALVLPLIRQICTATEGTPDGFSDRAVLASTLAAAGQQGEAELLLRQTAAEAESASAPHVAAGIWGALTNLFRQQGRLAEALGAIEKRTSLSAVADQGDLVQLACLSQRLQILAALGRNDEVLAVVDQLRPELVTLGASLSAEQQDQAKSWNIFELVLDTGRTAAQQLDEWQKALDFNQLILGSQIKRAAAALEIARTRFNDYGPLLLMDRITEASDVLSFCLEIFEEAGDLVALGRIYSAYSHLASSQGYAERAVEYEITALRYSYSAAVPEDCATSHFNLASFLEQREGPSAASVAHRLASVILFLIIGSGQVDNSIAVCRADYGASDAEWPMPKDFQSCCAIVEKLPGVQFQRQFQDLATKHGLTGDQVLNHVISFVTSEEKALACGAADKNLRAGDSPV